MLLALYLFTFLRASNLPQLGSPLAQPLRVREGPIVSLGVARVELTSWAMLLGGCVGREELWETRRSIHRCSHTTQHCW